MLLSRCALVGDVYYTSFALYPVLGKVLKKICLFCLFGSNVVALLRRALLVDALCETS